MSYTPTNWETGDTITAEKLNKLEQGVANAGGTGGGVLMIEHDEELGSFNKTYREVETAFLAGSTVIWYADSSNGNYYLMDGLYGSNFTVNFGGGNILMADSEDGYLYLPD